MGNLDDLDLNRPTADPLPPSRYGFDPWIVGFVALAAAIVVGIVVWRQWPSAPPTQSSAARPAAAPAVPERAVVESLPSLEGSDSLVRQLAKELTAHPMLGIWLAGTDLIRNFTVVVENMARGQSPARHLRFAALSEPFRAVERPGGQLVIDPRSYRRYDAAADAFASLDVGRSAAAYRTLKPLITAAYRELGHPEGDVDEVLQRALLPLLATPVIDREIALAPQGIVYAFADPSLEALTPAQKHLLRMGPRNVRQVQAKLRQLAGEMGLRVPPPSA